MSTDPFAVLGIAADADAETIMNARRQLAKRLHPDRGGTVAAMQELNAAAEAALGTANQSAGPANRPRSGRSEPTAPRTGVRQDHPSFTIEALPAEAFEGLLVAAASLGEVTDDDPPYLLEVMLNEPVPAWCRLELVPDAASSTVSITTARLPGHPTPDVFDVRDTWIAALNQLDWANLEAPQPPS